MDENGISNTHSLDQIVQVTSLINHPRKFLASWISPEERTTFRKKGPRTETRITYPIFENFCTERGLSIPTHNCTKTSVENNYDSLNEKKLRPNTPGTSTKNENSDYGIVKLVGHKKTPIIALYQVYSYGYDPVADTLGPDFNIPTHFIRKY